MNKAAITIAAALAVAALPVAAQDLPRTKLNVVGSLSNLAVYKNYEYPFWTKEIPERSKGQITVDVKGFNDMGFKGPEVLRLVGQGVIEFGTTVIPYLSADDAHNEAIDLAGLTTDPVTARKVTEAFKPTYDKLYREKFKSKVLGIWSYPAQVVYCNGEVKGLADLKGKKVRTSSRTQAELVGALGGTGVTIPFGEVVPALQNKVVDCAITGSLSGNFAKWHEVTTHLIPLPVSWNQIVFVANLPAWAKLDPKVRAFLETEVARLEKKIWDAVAFESQDGIDCNIGKASCKLGTKGKMTLVDNPNDKALLKKVVVETVVPKWAARCSADCVATWNATVGPIVGITAKKP